MRLARLLLLFMGILILGLGAGFLVAPSQLADVVGYDRIPPAALTDLRATYGGLQMGFGAFLLWAVREHSRYRAGVIALCLTIPAIGGSRAIGLLVDGDPSAINLLALAFEVGLTVISWVVLTKLPTNRPGD